MKSWSATIKLSFRATNTLRPLYQTVWTPAVGETLRLTVEPTNSHDIYTVALIQDGRGGTVRVVGHVPRNVRCVISFFLKKDGCVGYCKVAGERTNCGAGLGLEIFVLTVI